MSQLTDEFAALKLEMAADLGEGLLATIYESASTNIHPDANVPGATTSRTFNPDTQSYDESAAVTAGGVEQATTVAVPPPSVALSRGTDGQGTTEGAMVLELPLVTRSDGSKLVPMIGMRVGLLGRFWQITGVEAQVIGDGVCGYQATLSGGGLA